MTAQLRRLEASAHEVTSLPLLAALVRERAWAYLTAAAEPYELAAVAEDLFRLPRGDLRRLAAAHVGMSRETASMLQAAELVLRELPSTVARSQVEVRGAIRPPVAWRETAIRRLQTGDRSLFTCLPPERRYDTPLARLVKLSLARCSGLGEAAGLDAKGTTGLTLANRAARATRLGRHAKLRDVCLVERLPAHALRGALRVPGARAIVEFLSLYREAVEEQAPLALRDVVTRRLLIPSSPDRLLELFVGFQLVDELGSLGYERVGHRLLPGMKLPFARMRDPAGGEITIWFQRALRTVFPQAPEGRYRETLWTAGLNRELADPRLHSCRASLGAGAACGGEVHEAG